MNININLPKNGMSDENVKRLGVGALIVSAVIGGGTLIEKITRAKRKAKADKEVNDKETENAIKLAREKARAEAEARIMVMREDAEIKEKEHQHKLKEIELRNEMRSGLSHSSSNVSDSSTSSQIEDLEQTIVIPDARNKKREKKSTRYIVPMLISEGEIATIFGHEKIGKSYLGAQIAKDATMGGQSSLFIQDNTPIPKCWVYYYSAENWKDDVAERLPDGFLDEHLNFQLLEVDSYTVNDLLKLIRLQLSQYQGDLPILVIIDNLSAIVESVYSGEIDTLMGELIKIKKDTDEQGKSLTVLLFAHDKADKDLASAASVGRKVSTIVRFSEDSKNRDKRHIEIVRSNLRRPKSFSLLFKEEKKLHLEYVDEVEDIADNTVLNDYAPKEDGRGERWTEEDTARLIELASTLETPDKDHIADMMGRTPNMVYKMARMNGIKLMPKPRGRKPKQKPEPDEQ